MMYNPLPASGPFVRGLALGSCALPPGAGRSLLRGDPGRGQESSLRRPCSALLPAPAHPLPVLPRTSSPAPSSPFSSGPWKKQPQLPAFWQQFYSASTGHKDLNFCTRVVKVGLEEQQCYPAILCAWQHSHPQPHSASQCRWRTPLPSAGSPLGGLSEITAGREAGLLLTMCVRGGKKGNQHTPGEEKGGGLLLSFLCPVARPIKGIYCSPTHRWAAEEVCDSIHIPGQPAWGRSKTGKFSSPRQSCRHGAG